MTELNIFENYASKDFDVYFQNEAALNTSADLQYVKYGQDDIDNYVAAVSKPDLADYVNDQKQVIDIETTQSITSINNATQAGINDINNTIAEYEQNYVTTDTEQTISGDKIFEGSLQAVTPSLNDLSPNVATTAFVNGGNIVSQGTNHVKYSGGLTIQWGIIELDDSSGTTCTYEIPFETTSYSISLTHIVDALAPSNFSIASVITHSLTGFTLGSGDLGKWFWLAIGF